MNPEQISLESHDRLEIADALYRLGAGIDFNSAELLESAFTTDAIVDFSPAAKKAGVDFPFLEKREAIVQALKNSVCLLDTTHVITNPLIKISGDTAKLRAIVEAQHLPPVDHSRHFLMKNRYDVDLVRDGDHWLIKNAVIECVWFTGDPQVLLGK